MALTGPAAVGGYRFYTSRLTYLTDKGTKALQEGDVAEAKEFAGRLQMKGYDSAAHILRGKIFLSQAKEQLEKAPLPFPYEGMQRAAQIVLTSAGLSAYPPVLRGPAWLGRIQVQKSFRRQVVGVEDLLDALSEFTQVFDNDPWAAEATVLASECLVRLGDYRSAEQALITLVARQPDDLEARRWLAAIYIDVNARIPAAKQLQEWIRLDPKDPRPYRWLCLITRDTEEGYPQAIQAYYKLLELDLDVGQRQAVLKELAETLISGRADYGLALETLAQGPKEFQERPAIRLLRAECLLGLGNADEAARLVDGVLRDHPTLAKALLFRAKLYVQHDQPGSAIPLLEKLVALHPNHRQGRQNLMLAYQAIKDDQRAADEKRSWERLQAPQERLRELLDITAKEPWNGRARLELAILNSGINYSEALAWIRFAMASRPEDRSIRKMWTQLLGYQSPPLLRDYQRRRQAKAE
jgi:tetratricopeptide (TPR) repeat protein